MCVACRLDVCGMKHVWYVILSMRYVVCVCVCVVFSMCVICSKHVACSMVLCVVFV